MTRKGSHRAHLLCGRSASLRWAPPVTLMLMQLQTVSDLSMSPNKGSSHKLSLSPRGFICFCTEGIYPETHSFRIEEEEKKPVVAQIVGGISPKSTDRLVFWVQMLRKEQMHLPLQAQCIQSGDRAFSRYRVEGCPGSVVCRFVCGERSTKMSPCEDSVRDGSRLITHQVSAMLPLLKTQERLLLLFVPSTSLQSASPAL